MVLDGNRDTGERERGEVVASVGRSGLLTCAMVQHLGERPELQVQLIDVVEVRLGDVHGGHLTGPHGRGDLDSSRSDQAGGVHSNPLRRLAS